MRLTKQTLIGVIKSCTNEDINY